MSVTVLWPHILSTDGSSQLDLQSSQNNDNYVKLEGIWPMMLETLEVQAHGKKAPMPACRSGFSQRMLELRILNKAAQDGSAFTAFVAGLFLGP